MSFNTFANQVMNKVLNEELEVSNPEFAAWYDKQDPSFLAKFPNKNKAYRHWRAKNIRGSLANIPAGPNPAAAEPVVIQKPTAPVETEPVSMAELEPAATPKKAVPQYDTLTTRKTQVEIDNFKDSNPDATVEDIVAHLKTLNDSPEAANRRVPYITNKAAIEKMIELETEPAALNEPSASDIAKEKQAKIARIKQALLKLRSGKAMPKVKPEIPDTDDEEEVDDTIPDDVRSEYIPKKDDEEDYEA